MERELLITGIGGQGVQLCAQVLARAATLEGREVMYLGLYGGMMRGGNTDSTVVIADAPILAPPVVSRAWSAIAMHDDYWPVVEAKLRPGGLVLVNDTTFTSDVRADVVVHRVPATTVATDLGSPLSGSMVMLGAFCATTSIVSNKNKGVEGSIELRRGRDRTAFEEPHPRLNVKHGQTAAAVVAVIYEYFCCATLVQPLDRRIHFAGQQFVRLFP